MRNAFKDSIDEYLKFCAERGREPDKPFSGKVPLRLSPDLHRAASEAARLDGKSLNAWLSEVIETRTAQPGSTVSIR